MITTSLTTMNPLFKNSQIHKNTTILFIACIAIMSVCAIGNITSRHKFFHQLPACQAEFEEKKVFELKGEQTISITPKNKLEKIIQKCLVTTFLLFLTLFIHKTNFVWTFNEKTLSSSLSLNHLKFKRALFIKSNKI